ncbi:MAG: hypothetical protein AAFN93_20370 [Bacteroidota bacterium]
MKTSNILFVIFLGIGFFILTAFMIEMSTWDKYNALTAGQRTKDSKPGVITELPSFSHIKIKDMENVVLVSERSKTPQMERIVVPEDDTPPAYTVSGDTLIISPTDGDIDTELSKIVCEKGLKSITAINSHFIMVSLTEDSLSINLKGSDLRASDLNSQFGAMTIEARQDSRIEWFAGEIDNLKLEMYSSNGSFQLPIEMVDADLTNSYLQLKGAGKLMVQKREGSRLEVRE